MSGFILSPEALVELTGYRQPAKQLDVLHRAGFFRARRAPGGPVILERAHHDAVLRAKEEEKAAAAIAAAFEPQRVRQYDGSGLQRWSQERRAATEAAEERERQYMLENADEIARIKAEIREQYRKARPALIAFHANKRRAAVLRRTPAWADQAKILEFYKRARQLAIETGKPHHVDHVIPLQGALVSGLHVHNNLQILTASENSRKRNRYEVEP